VVIFSGDMGRARRAMKALCRTQPCFYREQVKIARTRTS